MGIASGPPRKAESERKGHRKYATTSLAPVRQAVAKVPELPDAKEMLARTRAAWVEFWRSPLQSTLLPDADMPALVRMFHLADELERCRREFRKKRLVEGSSGQPVLNPLGAFMLSLAKEVRALEDRFGANLLSRLRVSIDLNEAHKSLDAMNTRMARDEDEVVDDDPRLRAIDVGAS